MEQNIKPCNCGSEEFITQPNQYDVYQIIDGTLELIDTHSINDEEILFCRECSKQVVFE